MLDKLWCHVEWGTEDKIQASLFVKFLCKTEISNFDVEVLFVLRYQEDILRLHIPMGHRLQVHVV